MTWQPAPATADEDFAAAYEHAHGRVVRLAYLLCGDAGAAEEIAHDAWVNTYQRHLRDPIADLPAYVRRAVVNSVRNRARRRGLERAYVRTLRPRRVEDAAGSVTDRLAMIALLQRLPHRMRTVVVLRLYEDLSVADVAVAMGISQGTVKSATAKGLAKLQAMVEEDHDG